MEKKKWRRKESAAHHRDVQWKAETDKLSFAVHEKKGWRRE